MRILPLASDTLGGILAFYSLIHLPRAELGTGLREFHRVLRPGGRVLCSAHEGPEDVELGEFLQQPVPFAATLFGLDELVAATTAAGLEVTVAEMRTPYETEGKTVRLYIEARKPDATTAVG